MITKRLSGERGHADHGWLNTYHSFSFANYYDPQFMGFGTLRVINEDRVQPTKGFRTHPHRDMEIITYVMAGALEHKDSMGNGSVIHAGDVQRTSAGTGITHSEFNPSESDPVHFFQIWILPEREGIIPSYDQRTIPAAEKTGILHLVASHDGRDDSMQIHQDVDIYASVLPVGTSLTHVLGPGRDAWIQVAHGTLSVNGLRLAAGDGAAIFREEGLALSAKEECEFLLFDLG